MFDIPFLGVEKQTIQVGSAQPQTQLLHSKVVDLQPLAQGKLDSGKLVEI